MTKKISNLQRTEEPKSIQDIVTLNMKLAMVLHGANQENLANALGVSRSLISQKMTHRVVWTLDDIEKAAVFFDVEPAALVAGHGFEPWTSGL